MKFNFTITATDGAARLGVVTTAHGDIRTPAFMPVGTAATVKAMHIDDVVKTGADIILGNTYHLMLRPGAERIAKLGGLHKFMGWSKPILTDSGGFQVMSLAHLRKMTEHGVTFQSHIDGSKWELTPERSIEIQHLLGSTITMVFDECTPFPATAEQTRTSMEMSMRWAQRSKDAYVRLKTPSPPAGEGWGEGVSRRTPSAPPIQPCPARVEGYAGYGLFGIVQGGIFDDLREQSANALAGIGFDGYAIGGLAVGEGQKEMFRVLDYTPAMLPADKPRYLMGVGKPQDILGAVERGIDMFDCVIPTRSARNARAYTSMGEVNLRNARHGDDHRPLDPHTPENPINRYSRAYLHHLFKADEMLGPMLLTQANLHYYQLLMQGIRDAIATGRLADHAATLREGWEKGDFAPL